MAIAIDKQHTTPIIKVLDRLRGVMKTGPNSYMALCPAHDDKNPSLSVKEEENGKVLLYCHAGCIPPGDQGALQKFLDLLGLEPKDLYIQAPERLSPVKKPTKKEIVGTYDYKDISGRMVYQVVRYSPKGFSQRQPDGQGKWVWSLDGVEPIPYRLPELTEALKTGEMILITEGEKDVDNLYKRGFIATCNPMGAGKWSENHSRHFPLRSRITILPDNDSPGLKHAQNIARQLHDRGCSVRILELDVASKGDVSDWFDKGHTGEELSLLINEIWAKEQDPSLWEEHEAEAEISPRDSEYIDKDGCLYYTFTDRQGCTHTRMLANFFPKPKREIIRDDGQDSELIFEIGGTRVGGYPLPTARILASQFHHMSWVEKCWGLNANIEPGNTSRDRVRHCIQQQSGYIQREIIYTHTGFRYEGNTWFYIHAGGVIGGDGYNVDIEAGLERYTLPSKLNTDALADSISFMDVAPRAITVPLWGLAYLSPLAEPLRQAGIEPAFITWLNGPTGTGKSTLAALLLSHFGKFTNKTLPGSFRDTANYLERIAFILKDSLLVIDDYHPTNSSNDASKMEATAQNLCRIFGDRAARGRLTSDISTRKGKPARCMALITGEDIPNLGQSGMARILALDMDRDALDLDLITRLQNNSTLGQAMVGYIEWLVEQMEELPQQLKRLFLERRERASIGGHRRMPETAAWLYIGLHMGLCFVQSKGVITPEIRTQLEEDGWLIILELCQRQGQRIQDERPSEYFLSIMKEMLAAQEVDLISIAGILELSASHEEYGRLVDVEGESNKPFVGWYDDNWYYLLPGQVYRAITKFCRDQGTRFPVTENTLWKALDIDGYIAVENTGDRRRKVQKNVNGQKYRVIQLAADLL